MNWINIRIIQKFAIHITQPKIEILKNILLVGLLWLEKYSFYYRLEVLCQFLRIYCQLSKNAELFLENSDQFLPSLKGIYIFISKNLFLFCFQDDRDKIAALIGETLKDCRSGRSSPSRIFQPLSHMPPPSQPAPALVNTTLPIPTAAVAATAAVNSTPTQVPMHSTS